MSQAVAILSTTLISFDDGNYNYKKLTSPLYPYELDRIPHYVGHPATKYILDSLGAIYVPGGFTGLKVGESFYVAQLKDGRKGAAFTVDQPNVTPDDIKWGIVTRLPD
jgi:hypothetical protein